MSDINTYYPHTGRFLDENSESRNVVELVTGAFKGITSDHANIHNQEGYGISVINESLANNGTILVEFTTPDERYVHLKQYIPYTNQSSGKFEIIEAPTLTTGSTALTAYNRSRVGTPPTCGCVLKSDPTGISGGTLLETILIGQGGVGSGARGGQTTIDIEYVLKQETTYLFRLTNDSGSTAKASMWLFWYEEATG